MSHFAKLENVDPEELHAQYALTEALWSRLVGLGIQSGTSGRIEAFFFADHEHTAASLVGAFTSSGWLQEISKTEEGVGRRRVKVVTPEVNLTREAFLELVEVMMIAAHEHSCVFDGFQVATPVR